MATRHAVRPLSKKDSAIRRVAVALQGGGSHGAFTWGVLDRLLQEPGFEIVGASGTSAATGAGTCGLGPGRSVAATWRVECGSGASRASGRRT